MRIIFFGTPKFAADILQYLLNQKAEIVAVVTRPDKPRGRSKTPQPPPVKELALQYSLPIFQPLKASDPEFVSFLKTFEADLFIVAAYAEILKKSVLEAPRLCCINVHASVLPKYRGAAPIQRAIMAGEKESGVTIMKMAMELDAGNIFSIAKIPILENMTAGELTDELAKIGAVELWQVVQNLGKIKLIAQDDSLASYAKKLKLEDGEVTWDRHFEIVFNHIRGVTPKPGAWAWVWIKGEKKRLLIKKSEKIPNVEGSPGSLVLRLPNEFLVACHGGSIKLLVIQLEGKNEMSSDAFLRGISIEKISFISPEIL